MPIYFIPPGASFIGTNTVDGVMCNGWSLNQAGLYQTFWTMVSAPQVRDQNSLRHVVALF